MEAIRFRDQSKEHVSIRLPIGLARKLRYQALDRGRSHSELAAEALARLFGLDPAVYGIGTDVPTST